MPEESPVRVLCTAALVCLLCSIVVASAAVGLRPLQQANQRRDKQRYILQTAGLIKPGQRADIDTLFKQIEGRVVDLRSGRFVDGLSPEELDKQGSAADMIPLAPEDDVAGLGQKPSRRAVYVVKQGGRVARWILPVEGKGLWSTMRGFVAMQPDLTTIAAFCIYDHGETPGLGGEVSSPGWLALWDGKTAVDRQGQPILEVVKGIVDPKGPEAHHQIDGMSGATLTGRGVTNLIHFWLGQQGYGPLLEQLRKEHAHVQNL